MKTVSMKVTADSSSDGIHRSEVIVELFLNFSLWAASWLISNWTVDILFSFDWKSNSDFEFNGRGIN
jgi:hypothetical protein